MGIKPSPKKIRGEPDSKRSIISQTKGKYAVSACRCSLGRILKMINTKDK